MGDNHKVFIAIFSLFLASCEGISYNLKAKLSPAASVTNNENITLCESNAPGGSDEPNSFWSGDGSIGDPFLVCTAAQVNLIGSAYQDKHFVLINNIDMDHLEGSPFNMIVLNLGSFNGSNYEIKNFTIEDSSITHSNGIGFFQELTDASISNIKFKDPVLNLPNARSVGIIGTGEGVTASNIEITNIQLSADGSVGGIMGSSHFTGSFTNITVSGDISSTGVNVGGIIGYSTGDFGAYTEITSSSFSGTITSTDNVVGGIMGDGYWNRIDGANVNARIEGINSIGGIAGALYTTHGEILNSTSAGEIYSSDQAGGILGSNTNNVDITNTTSSMDVYASTPSAWAGKLFGDVASGTTYVGCSSTGTITVDGTPGTDDIGYIRP